MERTLSFQQIENNSFLFDVENMNLFQIENTLYQDFRDKKLLPNNFIPYHLNFDSIKIEYTPNLSTIHLNVAQVCNLACIYCYGVDGEYGMKGKMKDDVAISIIDYFVAKSKEQKRLRIVFFGGEPMLNFPLIKKTVQYCEMLENTIEKTFDYSIVTNGTKFGEEANAYLNEKNFEVTISFDGDKESHDKNRPFRNGKGSYDHIIDKIKSFLVTRDGDATARVTLTSHSHKINEYKEHLKQIGFKNVKLEIATLSEYSSTTYEVDDIVKEEYQNLLDIDKKESESILSAIKLRTNIDEYKASFIILYYKQLVKKEKKTQFCGVFTTMRGIAVNGDIYPCHRFVGEDKFLLGNAIHDERENVNFSFVDNHDECKKCFAKYFCGGGGCVHNNYVKNGDLQKLDWNHCRKLRNKVLILFNFFAQLSKEDKEYLNNQLNIKLN